MQTSDLNFAVVQFNPTVGALEANIDRMFELYREAAEQGTDLVIFPEMAVTGYPIEDLALSRGFVDAAIKANSMLMSRINEYTSAEGAPSAAILFGSLYPAKGSDDFLSCNAALLFDPLNRGHTQYTLKRELPNYGVFDEKRVFFSPPLDDIRPMEFRGIKLGVMICEDAWFPRVTKVLCDKGADVLISLNGSPFEVEKWRTRIDVVKARRSETRVMHNSANGAEAMELPFIYVNMVGGQDELVFDGGSFIVNANGVAQLPSFQEGITYCSTPVFYQRLPRNLNVTNVKGDVEEIYAACVLGTRDYMRKQGFKSVVLGMSGGVDSGIVAAIAADAIGPKNVHLVRLPSKFSSDGSLIDSERANEKLGTQMRTIEIEPIVDALRLAYSRGIFEEARLPEIRTLTGVADENIQARARGNILMAISNQEGHLLLTTGNKSEVSVGYSTLYGDMAGGFNPIKDCYKTTVWDMCRYRNAMSADDLTMAGFMGREAIVVPEEIITKPPSAELRENQQDSDSLPPYEMLDAILRCMIENQMSILETITSTGATPEVVARVRGLLDRAEYKRRQSAPGVKITSKLHGRERRVPIINHYAEKPPVNAFMPTREVLEKKIANDPDMEVEARSMMDILADHGVS